MIAVAGRPTKYIALALSWSGSWEACALLDGAALSGVVQIDWRGWLLTGTVDPARSGLFAGEGTVRIVGGFKWSTVLTPKAYQDDRGLSARELAIVVAGSVGETITVDASADRNLGPYFVVRRESGGEVLSRLFGRAWYVDTAGATHAGARASATLGRSVTVLNYHRADKRAEVYADRPDEVPLGAILPKDARLTSSRRVVKLIASAGGDKERLVAYTEAA